jgi:hypothetical protein
MISPKQLHAGSYLQDMRVSFDIDDTLVCQPDHSDAEEPVVPAAIRRWLGEPLRFGTRALIRELRRRGCSIWIYTSSGRSPFYIRRWLLMHGIFVDGVVNSERHRSGLLRHGFLHSPSKFPPAFGIDLHVDDSDGVRMEGDMHGFRVTVVRPDDPHWTRRVLDAVVGAQRLRCHQETPRSLDVVLPKLMDRRQTA